MQNLIGNILKFQKKKKSCGTPLKTPKNRQNGNPNCGSFTAFSDIFLYGPVNRLVLVRFQNRNQHFVREIEYFLPSTRKTIFIMVKGGVGWGGKLFLAEKIIKNDFRGFLYPFLCTNQLFLWLERRQMLLRTFWWFRF